MHTSHPTIHLPPAATQKLLEELQHQHQKMNRTFQYTTEGETTIIHWTPQQHLHIKPGEVSSVSSILVIPGTSHAPLHQLEPQAEARVEWFNNHPEYDLVVLSGGPEPEAQTEAYQMLERVTLRSVPVVLDVAANSTAANAVGAWRLQQILNPDAQIHSIASWSNALRQHLLFKKVCGKNYRKTNVLKGEYHSRDVKPAGLGSFSNMKRTFC